MISRLSVIVSIIVKNVTYRWVMSVHSAGYVLCALFLQEGLKTWKVYHFVEIQWAWKAVLSVSAFVARTSAFNNLLTSLFPC